MLEIISVFIGGLLASLIMNKFMMYCLNRGDKEKPRR
jgi:hypothetical protein